MKNILLKLIFLLSILLNPDISFAMKKRSSRSETGDLDQTTSLNPSKKQKTQKRLSQKAQELPPPQTPADEFSALTKNTKEFRILSAEDNDMNQSVLERLVKQNPKCTIKFANNGQEFLKLFNEQKANYYHMIFMDNQMPVMDGPTTVKTLKTKKDKKIPPIIGISSAFLPFDIEEFMNAGLDGYVVKPFTQDTLFSEMNKCLRAKTSE